MPEFTTSDGVSLHYTDDGAGTPVLALAGLTRNGSDFNYIAPHMTGVRFIRLDYRGRGQSDWADFETYTIPIEARDVLELLDHLNLPKVAVLGTSRGGLIAMLLAVIAKDRLMGVCLNDIGPELSEGGLADIGNYIGRNPEAKTFADATAVRAALLPGFANVPQSRWDEEVRLHYRETPKGLTINYDPKLRDAVEAAASQPVPDLWPFFDAMSGLPLALIRGENSNLLDLDTARKMQERRPDMIFANIADRGHVPFLDEPDAVSVVHKWLEKLP